MRRLLTTTSVYGFAALLGPLVAFALTPLYIGAIGVTGYGTVDLVQSVAQLLLPLALWGLPTTLIARAPSTDGLITHQPMFAGALRLVILVACGVSILAMGVAPLVAHHIQRSDVAWLVVVYALSLPGAAVYGVVLAMARLLGRIGHAVVLMVVYVLVLAMSRITLVLWFDAGVTGMIVALAGTNILVALLAIAVSWRWWWVTTRWDDVWAFGRLGLPLAPASIAVWMLLFIDRWFLVQYVTPLVLGQYAIATVVASLMAFVAEPFKQAWQPMARRHMSPQVTMWVLTVYVAMSLLVGALIVTWTPVLLQLIGGHDAIAATAFVPWLLIAPLMSGVVAIVSMPAIRAQQTGRLAWATLLGAMVNIGMNIWLIPQYGAHGAAWATAVAACMIPLLLGWMNAADAAITYDWCRLGALICAWIGYCALLTYLQPIGYRIGAFAALCVVVALIISVWRWRQYWALWQQPGESEQV
ncbi:MAG: hypothetical protein FJ040_02725 [Chloroflexi bacterium]|nr:hypothetical protein [Chloroflexota bacterium]